MAEKEKHGTSSRVASEAGKQLQNPKSTPQERSVAGSDLSQKEPDKKK